MPRWMTRWRRPGPGAAASQARIPDQVRHTEKWRLALEMIEEMTGPGGWGVLEEITAAGGARPVVAADAGYGDNTAFRLELAARGWQYAVAVKGTTSAYPATRSRRRGLAAGPAAARPATAARPPNLRQLAIASADTIQPVTWRQGTRATKGNPTAAMTSHFLAIRVRPANRDIPRAAMAACRSAGCWPNGRPKPTSPPITGCLTSRQTPRSPSWSGWPRSAGGSSTTTAS